MIELRNERIVSAAVPRAMTKRRQHEVVQLARAAVAVARDRKQPAQASESNSTSRMPSQNAGIDIATMKTSLIT